MSLYNYACAIYAEKSLDFEQILAEYAKNAYVYITPECIILADTHGADTWFIEFAIGKDCLFHFLEMAPFELEKVAWKRGLRQNSRLKIYNFKNLKRILYGRQNRLTSNSGSPCSTECVNRSRSTSTKCTTT
jgi:hypothetical protein